VELDELISRIKVDHKVLKKVEEPLSINIFTTSGGAGKSTAGVNGQFVFSQVLIDCLLRLKTNPTDKNELITLCKNEYNGNNDERNNLREFEQDYSVIFIDRLNNELRKRSYPDDNDISCAAKLTHSTYEEAVPHHLKRPKSADHILTTCCDSVSQVFENHSINSNITECEPRICSTSTINSLNQFNVSVEQKVRNKFVLRCM
jgi:hypothetical protein